MRVSVRRVQKHFHQYRVLGRLYSGSWGGENEGARIRVKLMTAQHLG